MNPSGSHRHSPDVRPPNLQRRVLLEVCVGSVAEAVAAADAGADRLELCSALCVGELTPSYGTLVEVRQRVSKPVMVMIRPREAGFFYDEAEFTGMCGDVEAALELGADGVVFGILNRSRAIDKDRCQRLVSLAANRQTVFHRAFDLTVDPWEALEGLIDLGITRVLTSGQQPTAIEGEETIRRLLKRAAGRIEILPGGGLNERNAAGFVTRTKCTQVHMGLSQWRNDPTIPPDTPIRFTSVEHGPETRYRALDPDRVRRTARNLGSP